MPVGARDLRTFRQDANEALCTDAYSSYEACVGACSHSCHEDLRRSKRTVHDDIDDWYQASCSPPLALAANELSECFIGCQANCSSGCNLSVTVPLGAELGLGPALSNCTRNCTAECFNECFTDDRYYDYEAGCRPPLPYNCTDECLGSMCPVVVIYCSVYDSHGMLRAIDPNCTLDSNVTFDAAWSNRSVAEQLAEPGSSLARVLGVNATVHTCYNECENVSISRKAQALFQWQARALSARRTRTLSLTLDCCPLPGTNARTSTRLPSTARAAASRRHASARACTTAP